MIKMGVDTRKSLPFNSSISYTMFFVVANLKILVPYNFDPKYLVEEINSHQHLINETTAQPTPFLYDSNHFSTKNPQST
jgi:hypothetical protein